MYYMSNTKRIGRLFIVTVNNNGVWRKSRANAMKGDFISAPYLSNLTVSCGFGIIYSARERGFFFGEDPILGSNVASCRQERTCTNLLKTVSLIRVGKTNVSWKIKPFFELGTAGKESDGTDKYQLRNCNWAAALFLEEIWPLIQGVFWLNILHTYLIKIALDVSSWFSQLET